MLGGMDTVGDLMTFFQQATGIFPEGTQANEVPDDLNLATPKPGVSLSGRTKAWAERVGAGRIELSMTHSKGLAAAVAVVADA